MGQELILVRHGESVKNRSQYLLQKEGRPKPPEWLENIPDQEIPLTPNGHWEAWRAGYWLKTQLPFGPEPISMPSTRCRGKAEGELVNKIISSPLLRAIQTARQIAAELKSQVITESCFQEVELPPKEIDLERLEQWLDQYNYQPPPYLIIVGSGNNLRLFLTLLLKRNLGAVPLLQSGAISWLTGPPWEIKRLTEVKVLNFVPSLSKADYQRL